MFHAMMWTSNDLQEFICTGGNMRHIDLIQEGLDYIEENLTADFQVSELASAAGYSLFHYYHVFRSVVGIPIMQYITRRRLLHGAFEIAKGDKVMEAALRYGFATKAGFYKAFKREFGCSPTEYVERHVVKSPCRVNLLQEEHIMAAKSKLKEILSAWNLEDAKVSDFYYNGTGNRADNQWNVGTEYLIKAGSNIAGLEHHIAIAAALAENGLDASVPVKTKFGNDYVRNGELYFCLFRKMNGACINSRDFFREGGTVLAQYMGEVIGKLDLVLKEVGKDFVCNEADFFSQVVDWALPKVREGGKLAERFFREYKEQFSVLYPNLPKQLIHRDPNPGNILLLKDEPDTAVIEDPNAAVKENSNAADIDYRAGFLDFDLSEKNIRIFDICYAATAILSEVYQDETIKNEIWIDIFQSIVCGYDKAVGLSEYEKKAIPYVIFGIQMICIAYFSEYDKYQELAMTNWHMLEWLIIRKEKLNIA